MYQRQVTFSEAVKNALTVNYCNFNGRASRSDFWWFQLFQAILGFVIGLLTAIFFHDSPYAVNIASGIMTLVFLLPNLGLCVRRLHDIGKSGWWIFISLIPLVGGIILLVWYCKASQPSENEYGPIPNMVA